MNCVMQQNAVCFERAGSGELLGKLFSFHPQTPRPISNGLTAPGAVLLGNVFCFLLPHSLLVHSCTSRGSAAFLQFSSNLLHGEVLVKIAVKLDGSNVGRELYFPINIESISHPVPTVAISTSKYWWTIFKLAVEYNINIVL